MKKRILQFLMAFLGADATDKTDSEANREGVTRHVVVVREAPVCWRKEDALMWNEFRKSGTWKKLEAMSADSIVQDVLPQRGCMGNVAELRSYVCGRQAQMEYLERFSAGPETPADPNAGRETDMPAAFEDEEILGV